MRKKQKNAVYLFVYLFGVYLDQKIIKIDQFVFCLDFRVSGAASSKVHKKDIDQIILNPFPYDQTTLEDSL